MSYETVVRGPEIRAARRALSARLKAELPVVARRLIGYPSGSIPDAPARFEAAGLTDALWWHRFPSEKGGVEVNLFGLNDTRESSGMNIALPSGVRA